MKKKRFVVEDHPFMLENLVFFINSLAGVEVCGSATTAEQALENVAATRPDLVLVDISLPGMSGIGLIQRLQECEPPLPALVVSGHSEDLYAADALRAGARGYVMKSDPTAIAKAVYAVLAGHLYLSDQMRAQLSPRPDDACSEPER